MLSALTRSAVATTHLSSASHARFFWIFKSRGQKFTENMVAAEISLKKRDFESAVEQLKQCIEYDDPKNPAIDNITKKLAFAYVSMKQFEQAITCYMGLQERRPDDSHVKIGIGLLYGKSQSPAKAIEIFDEVLAKNPEDVSVIQQIALHCEQLALFDKAIQLYEKAISISPDNIDAYINLGYIHVRTTKDCKLALPLLLKASELEKEGNVDLVFNIAMCYYELNDNPRALEFLNKCIEIDPSFHDAKRNIKFIQQQQQHQHNK